MSGLDPHALPPDGAAPLTLDISVRPRSDSAQEAQIVATAREANRIYTENFVEKHVLCPFAREGRRKGETRVEVVWLQERDERALLEPLYSAFEDDSCAVLQVVFPLLRVSPERWIALVAEATRRAHHLLGCRSKFAAAALHPALPYSTSNPYALIPLFRRAPDPTIQWVRLSRLEEVARGREKGSTFVDPAHLVSLVTEEPAVRPLYDRVAEMNQETALKLGVFELEAQLRQLHEQTQENYRKVL